MTCVFASILALLLFGLFSCPPPLHLAFRTVCLTPVFDISAPRSRDVKISFIVCYNQHCPITDWILHLVIDPSVEEFERVGVRLDLLFLQEDVDHVSSILLDSECEEGSANGPVKFLVVALRDQLSYKRLVFLG